jgi:predicted small secreted protein
MKTRIFILLAALALAGCSTFQGGTGAGNDTDTGPNYPTDFGRGGNRANPSPYDTQSGAIMPETDDMTQHGMQSGKFPPP